MQDPEGTTKGGAELVGEKKQQQQMVVGTTRTLAIYTACLICHFIYIYSMKNAWRLPVVVAVAVGIYPTDAISAVATTYTPRSRGLISSFRLFMRGHPALPLPTFCGVECGRPGVQATWALGIGHIKYPVYVVVWYMTVIGLSDPYSARKWHHPPTPYHTTPSFAPSSYYQLLHARYAQVWNRSSWPLCPHPDRSP